MRHDPPSSPAPATVPPRGAEPQPYARPAGAPGAGHPAGPNGEAEAPPWAAFSPARGRFVRFVVVFSVALTLLATASIYWRWANVYEPSSYIVVYGTEDYNGTQIVVRSPDRPDAMATLSPDNRYAAAIFLHPGSYTITATLHGEQLVQQYFVLGHRRAIAVNLPPRRGRTGEPAPAATAPRAAGDR